eukprot:6300930-Pyramimonas_sp.AAC.1
MADHMLLHFLEVELGRAATLGEVVQEFNSLPDLLRVEVDREPRVLPSVVDIEHVATDCFNLVSRTVLLMLRAAIPHLSASVRDVFDRPELLCATQDDWGNAQPDLSFVDDLT